LYNGTRVLFFLWFQYSVFRRSIYSSKFLDF